MVLTKKYELLTSSSLPDATNRDVKEYDACTLTELIITIPKRSMKMIRSESVVSISFFCIKIEN